MHSLHVPVNYGSLLSHSVRCLRLAGMRADGWILTSSPIQSSDGVEALVERSRSSLRRVAYRLRWLAGFVQRVRALSPDVIHWFFGRDILPLWPTLALARRLNIPRLVEWQGSDIRNPEIELAENPYYAAAFRQGYEYRQVESAAASRQRQAHFARARFACATPVGMRQYIEPDLFPHPYLVPQRIVLPDYRPSYPDPQQAVPVIVHSPSAPVAKGTSAVLAALEALRPRYRFTFHLVEGRPRTEALALMAQADIILDQFVLGDRGMVALEAMALGKPVVCYVKPSLAADYADEPLVNASPDTLADALAELISSPSLRHELGRRGRAHMDQHYQPADLAAALNRTYQAVIAGYQDDH